MTVASRSSAQGAIAAHPGTCAAECMSGSVSGANIFRDLLASARDVLGGRPASSRRSRMRAGRRRIASGAACARGWRLNSRIRPAFLVLSAALSISGCAQFEQVELRTPRLATSPLEPSAARTVEELDTTTAAERDAAVATGPAGRLLGRTVASLGDPTAPGFWIETPLVATERPGRLVYPANGNSVEITLIPSEGGSSRVSLAAMRLLEAPLAGLPTLEVHALP
ncbi:MAG: hypothetical protein F4103_17635 [Boseongicola sp. SB0673_bin_14]|nr:hypothetical protein [Boseongicola sp. SB0667_bin_21]MYI70479.1 hypothetical protein [Boseongicola sp. SB0673_bin_14]